MSRTLFALFAIALALTANPARAATDAFDWHRSTGGVPPPVHSPAPDVYAQATSRGADAVRAMDTDKDGMISRAEFMRMMEARFDAMDKNKAGKLTVEQVQQSITDIGKTYGYSN